MRSVLTMGAPAYEDAAEKPLRRHWTSMFAAVPDVSTCSRWLSQPTNG
jgi:hypothetical protein